MAHLSEPISASRLTTRSMYLELVQPNQTRQHQSARKTARPLQRYMRSARAGSLATVIL
jgi:hypothetical protein